MPATALALRLEPDAEPAPVLDPRTDFALAYAMAHQDAHELGWLQVGIDLIADDFSAYGAMEFHRLMERVRAIKGWPSRPAPIATDCWPLDWQDDYGLQVDYDDERQFGWAMS